MDTWSKSELSYPIPQHPATVHHFLGWGMFSMNSVFFFPNLFLFTGWQLRVIELRRLNRTSHCVNTFKTVKVLVSDDPCPDRGV